MKYCQTFYTESIAVHPLNDINDTQYVELIKYGDIPMFAVWTDDGEDEWFWEFEYLNPSDYERVKMSIFDAIFGCDTMLELAEALDAIFENDFVDILVVDECSECNGCEGCNKSKK